MGYAAHVSKTKSVRAPKSTLMVLLCVFHFTNLEIRASALRFSQGSVNAINYILTKLSFAHAWRENKSIKYFLYSYNYW